MANVFWLLLFISVWLQVSGYTRGSWAFAAWPHAFTTNTDMYPQASSFNHLVNRIGRQGNMQGSSCCPRRQATFASTVKAIRSADSRDKDLRRSHERITSRIPRPNFFLRQERDGTRAQNLPISSVDDGAFSSKKTQSCDYTTLCALAAELQVSHADPELFSMPFFCL
jgi:hypothetical protein